MVLLKLSRGKKHLIVSKKKKEYTNNRTCVALPESFSSAVFLLH